MISTSETSRPNGFLGQSPSLQATKALLLVGGLGTRLRAVVPGAPKPLAPVGDRPFLELLVRQLASQGLRQLVMCTGHMADQIDQLFGDGSRFGAAIKYSRESEPLGTAGAIKFAERFLQEATDFLVLNGDSFLEVDLLELLRAHRSHGALATIAVVQVDDAARYGTVRADESNKILEFCEKTGHNSPGLINAGIYVFNRAILEHIPAGPASLEKDVFPKLLERGLYAVKQQQGLFIDIGTPADYAKAQQLIDRLRAASGTGATAKA